MKKILFGSGSHAELPMILAAKKLGYYIITTGNNPEGLGHPYANEYIPGDFSDPEFIYNLAKEQNVEGIVSACNDFSYISTAYACEKLGLKGHDSYEISKTIHHKDEFRRMTRSIGIKTPLVEECFSMDDVRKSLYKLRYPVLVKPVDLTGGKGVKVCANDEEVLAAAPLAFELTRQDHIIIEEFITGSNHGASFILKNNEVIYSIFDDEQYGLNKYLVLGACSPSRDVDDDAKKYLINDVNKIVKHLNLTDGLFHCQFILNDNDEPIIIDPCRRAPGDLYVLLSKFVTGVDYPLEILKGELGLEIDDTYKVENNIVARECIMSDKAGVIDSIHIDESVRKHIIHEMIWAKENDVIEDIMKYKAGIIIMKFDDTESMHYVLDNYTKLVNIRLKEN